MTNAAPPATRPRMYRRVEACTGYVSRCGPFYVRAGSIRPAHSICLTDAGHVWTARRLKSCSSSAVGLSHRAEIDLIKIEYPVSIGKSVHNLRLHVPEIALLSGEGTGQLVDLLLWRYEDPRLA